jgi:hypothetical protein
MFTLNSMGLVAAMVEAVLRTRWFPIPTWALVLCVNQVVMGFSLSAEYRKEL